MITVMLRRSLMALSAIVIWAKALAQGRADPVNAEDRSKESGVDGKSPTVNPDKHGSSPLVK